MTYRIRYEEHREGETARCYYQSFPINTAFSGRGTIHGDVDTRPDWLRKIVEVGRIGMHGINPATPPPHFVIWFDVDEDKNLIRFDKP